MMLKDLAARSFVLWLAILLLLGALPGCPDDADDDDASADDDDVTADDDDDVTEDDDDSADDDDVTEDDDDSADDDDDSSAVLAEVDDLAAHIELFIANNFPDGDLDFSLEVFEVVDGLSDPAALAAMSAASWTVLDGVIDDGVSEPPSSWATPTGDGEDLFANGSVLPALVDGAVVVEVSWDWDGEYGTNYAVVAPGGGAPDEVDAFLVAAIDSYRVLDGARDDASFSVLDGFGNTLADFTASLSCANDVCEGEAVAWDDGVGCGAETSFEAT